VGPTAPAVDHPHRPGQRGGGLGDEELVVDGNLITSRTPADLPAFCHALLEQLK
jgi:putative intracellular protease/amidase